MAYVLGVLAVFGLLTALTLRHTRFNDALVSRERWDAQARLLAASGVDLALARIDPPGPAFHPGFTSEGIERRLDDPRFGIRARVAGRGLLARVEARGTTTVPAPGRTADRSALAGQSVDLAKLPALGLLNREGNMVIAGRAEVVGPVLLWRGAVRKATDYHLRWSGGAGHAGPVWDSTSAAWQRVEPDWSRASDWIESQGKQLASGDASLDGDYDSGAVADYPLSDSIVLVDTALAGVRIRAASVLKAGAGAVLVDCKLLAPRIVVEPGADLTGVLAFASKRLDLRGGKLTGGQYAAVDTLRLDLDEPLADWPVFYVHGRVERSGRPDSSYAGLLEAEKAGGEAILLAGLVGRPVWDQQVRLSVAKGVDLTGLIFCNGFARMEGRLRGSFLCRNLRFEHGGTIWLGHLRDARLEAFTGTKRIPAPLLFPGFPLLARTDLLK